MHGPPAWSDWSALASWEELGVQMVGDLYEDGTLLSFQTLRDRYGLPRGDYLLHAALIAGLQRHWSSGLLEPPTSQGCQYVVMAAGTFKAITCLYRRLIMEKLPPLQTLRHKWEEDLGREIPEAAWSQLLRRAWKGTRNARFQLVQFFTIHRAYLTPVKISKYFGTTNARCPRCREEGADLSHILWSCDRLREYWEEVVACVNHITDRTLTLDMSTCILLWFPHTSRTKVTSKFGDLAFILAKREITLHWKAPGGPNITRWKNTLLKWARSEGTLRLQLARRTQNDKALEAARAWEALVLSLQTHMDHTVTTSPTEACTPIQHPHTPKHD